MITLHENAPMHVKEGIHTAWVRSFCWMPHQLEQGNLAWLRWTWRRRFHAPLWFDPAPVEGWYQYSDEKLSFWERHT